MSMVGSNIKSGKASYRMFDEFQSTIAGRLLENRLKL